MPAKYWRFEGGYQDAPEPAPDPPAPCPGIMAGWNCVPNYQQWGCAHWGYPGWSPPPQFVPGPVYINGLQSPPPAYANVSPAPPNTDGNLPPAPPEEEKKEKKSKEKKENPYALPKMPEGCNYMFDKEHTMLHIFNNTHAVWKDRYKKEEKKFKMFKVSVNFTVKMVIENVLRKTCDDCKGWAATEAVELGGGAWAKGSTIEYESDKAKGTLKDMAWTTKRGDKLPPVWLVVHKV